MSQAWLMTGIGEHMVGRISSFTIDQNDVVTEADAGWTEFAQENLGNDRLVMPAGCSLWDLVQDPGVRQLYAMLLNALRTRPEKRIAYPFRCDSPFLKRQMRMVVEAAPDGRVRFTSYLDSSEDNTPEQFMAQQSNMRILKISAKKEAVLFEGAWTDIIHALCGAEIFCLPSRLCLQQDE